MSDKTLSIQQLFAIDKREKDGSFMKVVLSDSGFKTSKVKLSGSKNTWNEDYDTRKSN